MQQDSKLYKSKIILKENHIFSFKFDKFQKKYELESVHPLIGYYVCMPEELDFKDVKFYPFGLLPQWGNTFANMRNYFLFIQKETRDSFAEKLNAIMGIKDFSDDYKMLNTLGKGQFGKVKLAECLRGYYGKVAVKIIHKYDLKSEESELIRNEIDILKFLSKTNHPNFLRLYDVYEDRNSIYIVTELVKDGCLSNIMEEKSLSYPQIKSISKQIIEGLSVLNKYGIIHRDLKPDNILLHVNQYTSHTYSVKIIDFGLAKVIGKNEKTSENFGTLSFTAPEILLKSGHGEKVDIWSFGVLLYYLLYKSLPFIGTSKNEIVDKICFKPALLPHNPNIDKEDRNLVRNCLEANPQLRIDIAQIKNSKWWFN